MDLAFDVETYEKKGNKLIPILDGTGKHFLIGSITNGKGESRVFENKEKMWNYIIEQGLKERRNGKCVYAFGHNVKYDFFNLFKPDKNLVILSEFPFIANYYVSTKKVIPIEKWENYKAFLDMSNRKYQYDIDDDRVLLVLKEEAIRFLDSMSIYKMSLRDLGNMIGLQKLDLPKELEKKELSGMIRYVMRDTEILIEAMKMLKKKIKDDGINIKRIVTMNQIAISYLLKMMKEEGFKGFVGKGEKIVQSKWRGKIRKAYRGGRVEAWELGITRKVSGIDCNSLYPYSASIMRFPDLRTETVWQRPNKEYWEDLLKKTGICRALVYNKSCRLGLLSVRTPNISYYPKEKSYLIGTWTNKEIVKALEEGYELIDVQFLITYEDTDNPFKIIMPKLYQLRKSESVGDFNRNFYKQIMNGGIGKFAQIRLGQEFVFDSIEKTKEYLKQNYEIIRGISDNSRIMMFGKTIENWKYKPYYCPIIPTLVTAEARMYMYDIFKKIGQKRLIYTDTDSVVFKGNVKDLPKEVRIGEEMGVFKVEFEDAEFECWGRKNKRVNEELKLVGVSKNDLKVWDKETGEVKFVKMQGLKKENVGEFVEDTRHLFEQVKEFEEQEKELENAKVFIDKSIIDDIHKEKGKGHDGVEYFAKRLKNIVDGGK